MDTQKSMIDAKIQDGKFSLSIKLFGKKEVVADFYIDTGFNGYFKIDKKLFDDLGLEATQKKSISLADGGIETADMARVRFEVDQASGETEVMAVGWGGKNLIGTKFFGDTKMILVIDGVDGIHLSSDRKLAFEIGKTIYQYHTSGISSAQVNK
jgi:predicted aspartyl protease